MKSHLSGLLLTALIVCLVATPVEAVCPLADPADCIYVDDDCNTGTGGTGTDLDPFCSIQDAWLNAILVTSVADPKTILVREGTYHECVVASGNGLVTPDDLPTRILAEAFDPLDPETSAALTTITGLDIDGTTPLCPGQPTIWVGGTGATLDGFRVTGSDASGVSAQGGVVITNNLITGNSGIVGGGMYVYTGSCIYEGLTVNASLTDNIIRGNSAVDPTTDGGDGGGVFVWARESLDFAVGPCGATSLTISGNTIENNTASNTGIDAFGLSATQGGGLYVLTEALLTGDVEVLVTQNTITGNSALENTVGYGGGIWASTGGAGTERIEIVDNTVMSNSITADGGGISAWIQNVATGRHSVEVRGNDVVGNLAGANGGGLDLFAFAADLDTDASFSLVANSNLVDSNTCADDGGGVIAAVTAARSIDDSTLFTSPEPEAEEMTLMLSGNTITGNTAGLGGGGAILLPLADADPDGTGLLPFCSTHFPTVAHIELVNNLVADNHALAVSTPQIDIIGGGILAIPAAVGEALATVTIDNTTVASNRIDFGFVGGIEMQVDTREDCCADPTANACAGNYLGARGSAAVNINNSIVDSNDNSGIGGPEADPLLGDILTATVVGTYSFGHDDPPSQNFEVTVFPDGAPAGNFDEVDPELNDDFVPSACSVVFGDDAGICSYDPLVTCTSSFDCMTCDDDAVEAGQACTVDGDCTDGLCERVSRCSVAGHVTSPDLALDGVRDAAVNGIDLLTLALAFGSSLNVPPTELFDMEADLDGNNVVDGDDLISLASEFGSVCP